MTPLTLDSTSAVGSVRRPTATDNTRANAGENASPPADNPTRPSVVLNLNSSATQTALSNLTYGNPRAGAAARAAEAQAQAANAPRAAANPTPEANALDTAAAARTTDRQNLQAAQATNTSRQAVAADQTA